MKPSSFLALSLLAIVAATCADQEVSPPLGPDAVCTPGAHDCFGSEYRTCADDGTWELTENCASVSYTDCDGERAPKVCTIDFGCKACSPGVHLCHSDQIRIVECAKDGESLRCDQPVDSCSVKDVEICVGGDAAVDCRNACEVAANTHSYVGCAYVAVDLDNANVGDLFNAAAQQFAVVVSNPSPSLTAEVTVERNDAPPGDEPIVSIVKERIVVGPLDLAVIELDPREVDGSPPGEFDTGTHTALTSNAYRIRSTAPIIAYQFNPLDNVDVFSNDASLLVPVTGLSAGGLTDESHYTAIGWPQTIADTENEKTDFGRQLRATLTIVGTVPGTHVSVTLSTDIAGSPAVGDATSAGDIIDVVLGEFDVLNLETDAFNSDFSGTLIDADRPVAVFSGNEASDVPYFPGIEQRQCCADHLEEQLFPMHTLGTQFIAVRSPSRTCALAGAGSDVTCNEEEYDVFRFVGTGEFPTVTTSLDAPYDAFTIDPGRPVDLRAYEDFVIHASSPISVGQFVTSQWVVCGPGNNDEPCGDPAFILLPPVEQFREDYVFLVPDKYVFDYLLIAAPRDADVRLNGESVDSLFYCERGAGPPLDVTLDEEVIAFGTITCALSQPEIDSGSAGETAKIDSGDQYDGVHRLEADAPVGLLVYGFDSFVSYGYVGGTNLLPINLQ
ncbi:MAG: IgGFc-binding protein [Myxococcota bacterium]